MIFVQGHKSKNTGHRFFPAFLVHFLHKNIDTDFHTGIPDGLDAAHQLDNGTRRNGMCKIDTVRRNGNTAQPRKPRCGNKCDLIHHRQRSSAEKGIVMIRIIRENSFKNPGFRNGNSFF